MFWLISSDTLDLWSPWSLNAQAAYLSFRVKNELGKNSRKNQVFWPIFMFWSISLDTLVPWSQWSPSAQATYLIFQGSKWTEPNDLTNFHFLVYVIRHTGCMVTTGRQDTSSLSVLINFCFLVNIIKYTGLMDTRRYQYTGGLSYLPVV